MQTPQSVNIFRSWIFWAGLALKLVLAAVITAPLLHAYFIPFVSEFVGSGFENPYASFLAVGKPEAFPYPMAMLYALLPSGLLAYLVGEDAGSGLVQLIYTIPLLLGDLAILWVLSRWTPPRKYKRVLWLYWMSPVLIYISYVHGQLDVIPVALFFLASYALLQERWILAGAMAGLACSSKTSMLLGIPFCVSYLWVQRCALRNWVIFGFSALGVWLLSNSPYLLDSSFIEMVFSNEEQNKLFDLKIAYTNSLHICVIFILYALVWFQSAQLTTYNRDLFVMFVGFGFASVLLCVAPMPGWYFWVLPFIAYFHIKNEANWLIFLGLQLAYFAFFLIPSDWPVPELDIPTQVATFTLLQLSLLINCAYLYRKGYSSYTQHKITARPFLVGIGGDSGVGKSRLSNSLARVFGTRNTVILRGDDMHKWERGNEEWKHVTHLSPAANDLHEEISYLKRLKTGKTIHRRHYDHDTGRSLQNVSG